MKNFIVILFLVMVSVQVLAAGSYIDLFHIGKVGTTANTVLEIGDTGEFRYDFGNSKMQFSHDGTNFYDVIGLDDTVTIQNKTFDQTNKAYFNSFPVFHWNSRGSLIIDKEDTGTEGGQIQLLPADSFTQSVYVDNNSDNFRVHNGTNVWFTANANGIDAVSKKIVNVATPTLPQDAANKDYVDNQGTTTPTLAKGGLITNNGASDVAQAVGANTFVLTADSAQANGIKWAAAASGGDHTLDSVDVLKNKTLDSSNVINTGDFGPVAIELTNDTTQGAIDRASLIDFHASGGVDYNFRIIRNQGVNGSANFQNTGTGSTGFYYNFTEPVFYYNSRGKLVINRQNDTTDGGELQLDVALGGSHHAIIDNVKNLSNDSILRVHNVFTVFSEFNLNTQRINFYKPFTLGATAVGGNVPFGCTIREAFLFSGTNVSKSCVANEIVVGGGCSFSAGNAIRESYPSTATSWNCLTTTNATFLAVRAICCLK